MEKNVDELLQSIDELQKLLADCKVSSQPSLIEMSKTLDIIIHAEKELILRYSQQSLESID